MGVRPPTSILPHKGVGSSWGARGELGLPHRYFQPTNNLDRQDDCFTLAFDTPVAQFLGAIDTRENGLCLSVSCDLYHRDYTNWRTFQLISQGKVNVLRRSDIANPKGLSPTHATPVAKSELAKS